MTARLRCGRYWLTVRQADVLDSLTGPAPTAEGWTARLLAAELGLAVFAARKRLERSTHRGWVRALPADPPHRGCAMVYSLSPAGLDVVRRCRLLQPRWFPAYTRSRRVQI